MTDKLIHLIRWDGDSPRWLADAASLDAEDLNALIELHQDSLVFRDPEISAIVQVPLRLPNGRPFHVPITVPGLALSKQVLNRTFRGSEFSFEMKRNSVDADPDADIWSDDRHDAEIESETRRERTRQTIAEVLRRLIMFQGNCFLVDENLSEDDQEERLLLLVEDFVNKRRLELERLRKRVRWQRRMLGLENVDLNFERRDIPDELVRQIIDRDEVCRRCGSHEDLQLDHIIPVSRGGNDTEENLRLLCGACNRKRGDLSNL